MLNDLSEILGNLRRAYIKFTQSINGIEPMAEITTRKTRNEMRRYLAAIRAECKMIEKSLD